MYGKGKEPRLAQEQKGYHGSAKETHKIHGGEMAGTKEVGAATAFPGKAAMKVKPVRAKESIEKDSGKSGFKPKGMKTYSEE